MHAVYTSHVLHAIVLQTPRLRTSAQKHSQWTHNDLILIRRATASV